jgi:predicted dienelactone hydrolase
MTHFPILSRGFRLRTLLLTIATPLLVFSLFAPAWIEAHTTRQTAIHAPTFVDEPAPDAFKVADFDWRDEQRSRSVPVRLFWPAAAQSHAVPLVIFSPGIGSSRDGYTYLGRYWAEHGIASLHLQHVGSDRSLWTGDLLTVISRFQQATSDSEAIARVEDAHFALDQLLASRFGASIEQRQIIAAGHSYGATTTLLEAGARVIRGQHVLQFRDPRISAAIVFSAPPFYGDADFGPILSPVTIPTLHITSTDDVIRLPGFGSDLLDRQKVFDATGSAFKILAIYSEGSHNVFTERRYFDSLQVATEVKSDAAALSLAFLRQLQGQRNALADWSTRQPGLIAKYVIKHG